jgi:hypothetical protein
MRCTNAALDAIIREWKVAPDFLDVFLKFGNQRLIFEDSSGFKQMYLFPDGSFGRFFES